MTHLPCPRCQKTVTVTLTRRGTPRVHCGDEFIATRNELTATVLPKCQICRGAS